jgi:hypothetical protein
MIEQTNRWPGPACLAHFENLATDMTGLGKLKKRAFDSIFPHRINNAQHHNLDITSRVQMNICFTEIPSQPAFDVLSNERLSSRAMLKNNVLLRPSGNKYVLYP